MSKSRIKKMIYEGWKRITDRIPLITHYRWFSSRNGWLRIAAKNYYRAQLTLFFKRVGSMGKRPTLRRTDRKPQIVVSLTSIPPRLFQLHVVIESILRQTLLPDRIVLWLSREHRYRDFEHLSESDIPDKLLRLQNRGLEIRWTEDLGPYRKLLPSLREFPDDIILTIDDDMYYRPVTVESLYNAYLRHGDDKVYCLRSRIIQFKKEQGVYAADELNLTSRNNDKDLFFTGCGGVLYPPRVLPDEVFDEEKFLQWSKYEDDCWFNIMAKRNGKRIFHARDSKDILLLPNHARSALTAVTGKENRNQFNSMLTHLIRQYEIRLTASA